MRQGALPRLGHGTGGRRSSSPRSAGARSRSAGGGAHPPRPARAPARLSAEGRASSVTVPWAACSLPIRLKELRSVRLGSFLPGSEPPVPSCAGSPLPAAGAVTAAARPLARPSRQLPPRDVPSCVRVCVSKRISSSPSLGRAGPRRPAAEWLPVHTLRALPTHSAPTPPRPLPPFPAPPPAAAPPLPKAVEKPQRRGRGRVGNEAQVSSAEIWAHTAERLAAGGGQGLRQRKGRRAFTRRQRSCG